MIPPAVYIIVGYGAIFVMSIVLHEVAHGYVAYRCGDPTAKMLGRLTLNPIRHIDPFMTLLLPIMCLVSGLPMFGGAKAVPVNPYLFRHRISGERLVSTAGVLTNLLIAWLLAAVLHGLLYLGEPNPAYVVILGMGIFTNLLLFVFNMLPMPPLDGSRFVRTFLPDHLRAVFDRMDRFGIMIVFLVIIVFRGGLSTVLFTGIDFLWRHFLRLDAETFYVVLDGFGKAMGWH
ncbi:MAG TPA: site-2 protease family protein [Planctomycetota bacterium]|nr:site-2 protease family protein [Planctomycetota bacterium]